MSTKIYTHGGETMEKLILSEDEIVRICERLGNEIDAKLDESNNGIPVFMGVMNGALPFFYELIKHIKHKIQLDTIKVSSYDGTSSTGKISVTKMPDHNLEGRDVILVEDIIDTGNTMYYMKEYIKEQFKPKNLYTCILIKRNNINVKYDELADFTGLVTDEQRYIVGFGFDYYGLLRNEPYVYVPSMKDIQELNVILDEDKQNHADMKKEK